jgi:aminoglycoside/choline kinase family phosphotransferase
MTPESPPLTIADSRASHDQLAEGHLRAMLDRAFPNASADVQVLPLRGDASDRRYYRLRFATPVNDLASVILMRLAAPYTAGELPFTNVQRHLAAKGVPVPAIFYDDAAHGYVVLEDLGDATLEAALCGASPHDMANWYHEAVDMLLAIQQPTDASRREGCVAYSLAFDVDKLMWELDFFRTHMLGQLCGGRLTSNDETALRRQFWRISTLLARQPRVLTHRDYHSRNLMRHRGRLYAIDFQDARLGPRQYDLASLLYDSYVVLPDDLRAALLHYYLEGTNLVAGHQDHEDFLRVFDYMCLQRNLKALGTFAYQIVVKQNMRYASAIPPTLGYIQAHLARRTEFTALKAPLEAHLFAALPAVLQDAGTHTPDRSPAR